MWNEFYVKRAIEKEAIHDSDLELFAIQKARELDWDHFKASDSFIKLFKKEHRISSRRYKKLITRVSSTRSICTLKGMSKFHLTFRSICRNMTHMYISDAHDWVESQRSLILNYSPDHILNSDHCSFQQEYVSPRTLSFTGERTTEVAVKKKNNITHFYTLQPVTSADGPLLHKFFLILQEKENEFGKRVKKM